MAEKPLLRFLTNSSLKSFFGNPSFRNPLSEGLKGLLYDLKHRATEIQNEIYPGRTVFSRSMMDRLGVVLFYGREEDIESLTTNKMVEFGLAKMLSDSYAPGALIADLTKMGGGKPEIYQA